jgi:hypothetical protein
LGLDIWWSKLKQLPTMQAEMNAMHQAGVGTGMGVCAGVAVGAAPIGGDAPIGANNENVGVA